MRPKTRDIAKNDSNDFHRPPRSGPRPRSVGVRAFSLGAAAIAYVGAFGCSSSGPEKATPWEAVGRTASALDDWEVAGQEGARLADGCVDGDFGVASTDLASCVGCVNAQCKAMYPSGGTLLLNTTSECIYRGAQQCELSFPPAQPNVNFNLAVNIAVNCTPLLVNNPLQYIPGPGEGNIIADAAFATAAGGVITAGSYLVVAGIPNVWNPVGWVKIGVGGAAIGAASLFLYFNSGTQTVLVPSNQLAGLQAVCATNI